MSRRAIESIGVHVGVEELRRMQRVLKGASESGRVNDIVDAHIAMQEIIRGLLARPRRVGGDA